MEYDVIHIFGSQMTLWGHTWFVMCLLKDFTDVFYLFTPLAKILTNKITKSQACGLYMHPHLSYTWYIELITYFNASQCANPFFPPVLSMTSTCLGLRALWPVA